MNSPPFYRLARFFLRGRWFDRYLDWAIEREKEWNQPSPVQKMRELAAQSKGANDPTLKTSVEKEIAEAFASPTRIEIEKEVDEFRKASDDLHREVDDLSQQIREMILAPVSSPRLFNRMKGAGAFDFPKKREPQCPCIDCLKARNDTAWNRRVPHGIHHPGVCRKCEGPAMDSQSFVCSKCSGVGWQDEPQNEYGCCRCQVAAVDRYGAMCGSCATTMQIQKKYDEAAKTFGTKDIWG